MPICKDCIYWNRDSNSIALPDGTDIVQVGEILNAGGTGKTIAKCTNNAQFWGNINRALVTASFFDDAWDESIFSHVESMGAAEDDDCPFYSDRLLTSIVVTSTGGDIYCNNGGTLQMLAAVLPIDAVDTTYTWSVVNGTGTATIDGVGLLIGTSLGTIQVLATANDAGAVIGTMNIEVIEFVASITVSGFGGSTVVKIGTTLQMSAAILAVTATIQIVAWSVINGSGSASIDSFGLLTAGSLGTVTVRATAIDGSGVYDEEIITVIPA